MRPIAAASVLILVGGLWETTLTALQKVRTASVVLGMSEVMKTIFLVSGAWILGETKGLVIAVVLYAFIKGAGFVIWAVNAGMLGVGKLSLAPLKVQWEFAMPFAGAVVARAVADGLPQYLVA